MDHTAGLGKSAQLPIHVQDVDWSKLRLLGQSTSLAPPSDILGPDPDAFQLLRWVWRAEDATKARRLSRPRLGNQLSVDVAEFDGDSFVTEYENGDIWAVGEKPEISGTFIVLGAIRDRYRAIRRARSGLGHPVSEEMPILDNRGRYQRFSHGEMYWSPTTSAWEVYGDIFVHYADIGKVGSWLGYPVTGEFSMPGGRFNGFEHGQITWRAFDRHIEAESYHDKILATYNRLGGIHSPLGLPTTSSFDIVRNGDAFTASFRGGNITILFAQATTSTVQTVNVQLWFRGIECQVRQETSDEIFGSVGCFVPSTMVVQHDRFGTFKMGKPNARVAKHDALLYSGPPSHLYISTGLRELDEGFSFEVPVSGEGDQLLYESARDSITRFGAPASSSPADAFQREEIVHPLRYKVWFQSKYYQNWNSLPEQNFDLYPPGFIHIKPEELQSQPEVKTAVNDIDFKTLPYTHTVSVTAVDDGGDTGVYAFYFEVIVT